MAVDGGDASGDIMVGDRSARVGGVGRLMVGLLVVDGVVGPRRSGQAFLVFCPLIFMEKESVAPAGSLNMYGELSAIVLMNGGVLSGEVLPMCRRPPKWGMDWPFNWRVGVGEGCPCCL